jgi:subtilisin-like proprotein convertase family protein
MVCSYPALAIPDDDAVGVSDSIVMAMSGAITDLDVVIDTTHAWVGDLVFSLTHDGGASAVLIDQPGVPTSTYGCDGDDIAVTLDDDGAQPVEDFCADSPALFGVLIPNDPLASFNAEDLSGTWTLTAIDDVGTFAGTFDSWCLLPTVETSLPAELFADGFESGDVGAWSDSMP